MVPSAPRKGRDLMSDWPTLYTVLFVIACGSAISAAIALPFVYRKGMREIDQAMSEVFADRDHDGAVSNVRILKQYDRHAKFEAARRRSMKRHPSGGAS